MNTSNRIFTQARLGRHWSPELAAKCIAHFGAPYQFDWQRERAFIASHPTDFEVSGYNLLGRIQDAENEAHGILAAYDNGGETCDRYTLYLAGPEHENARGLRDCLCLSDHPSHPQFGFSQFSTGSLGLHNGKSIGIGDLPEDVRRHAIARLCPQSLAA